MKPCILGMSIAMAAVIGLSSHLEAGGLEVGGKIGLNAAGVYGEGSDEWGSRNGVCVGGLVSYSFNRLLGIQSEFLYSQKGARRERSDREETTTLRIDYIEIPILAKFSTIGGGTFCCIPLPGGRRTSLYLGPALGIKISSSAETEAGGMSTEEDADVNALDVGLALGVSTGYGSEAFSMFADFRLTAGLVSSYSEPNGPDLNNWAGSMAFGIAFAR
jgi:hypothetical protein